MSDRFGTIVNTPGHSGVDFETRVDFERGRSYRLARAREALERSEAREWMDTAIDLVRPGVGTDQIALSWPAATDFGFATEMDAFGLQFGHGLGLGLHERPVIRRRKSLRDPIELQAGMVFALETYCPASDGVSAARIEEEIVITETGTSILTHFPAQEFLVANRY